MGSSAPTAKTRTTLAKVKRNRPLSRDETRRPRGPARCRSRYGTPTENPSEEGTIHKLTLGIVGAAAVVAGLLLVRQQKQSQPKQAVPEAESASGSITLERMRELGL